MNFLFHAFPVSCMPSCVLSWICCFMHSRSHVCHHVSFQLGSVVCVPSLAWAGHIKLINRRARTRKCDKLCENAVEQVQNGKRRRKMRYLSWSTRVCLNNSATARPICPIPAAEMWHLLQPFAICLQLFFNFKVLHFFEDSGLLWVIRRALHNLSLFVWPFLRENLTFGAHYCPIFETYDVWYVNSHGGQFFESFVKSGRAKLA